MFDKASADRRVAVVTGGSGAVGGAIAARLPRPLTPDDTAALVAMLAGDDAAALTGQTLTVDGGLVLR
jgi:NAD(P)-dependent dehydrogenase (short-subunit alcohol dehydrogenase family)